MGLHNSHAHPLLRVIGALLGLIVVFSSFWVVADAVHRERGPFEAIGFGVGVFCCVCLGLPLYLYVRNQQLTGS